LLATILGSTDPAALIPTLKRFTFKGESKRLSDIAIAESALNDAVGAIFTAAVASMILSDTSVESFGGLIANYNQGKEYVHTTLPSMEIKVESIAKPTIFMRIGPFVALGDLWDTPLLGLLVPPAFILIARPLAVKLALLPTDLKLKDKAFLAIVRETGVIPVVLAVLAGDHPLVVKEVRDCAIAGLTMITIRSWSSVQTGNCESRQ
jgi:NhaP-type Na+/H+ or K+/H+ antiporter